MTADIKVEVRAVDSEDLEVLATALGQRHYFARRLKMVGQGHGRLLVAWHEGEPIGDVYVWLGEAEEPEIREFLPGIPLLTHLEVLPQWRNQGVGTVLINAVEDLLLSLDHTQVALGVGLDNEAAIRLYLQHGFTEWPHPPIDTTGEEFTRDGERVLVPEKCRVFVKPLVKSKT